MIKQITLEQALELVSFEHPLPGWGWRIRDVYGDVNGHINGFVNGRINGFVNGDINGSVHGNVFGTINGRKWESVETPKEKLHRLIAESGNQELIDTFNQMEDNS